MHQSTDASDEKISSHHELCQFKTSLLSSSKMNLNSIIAQHNLIQKKSA